MQKKSGVCVFCNVEAYEFPVQVFIYDMGLMLGSSQICGGGGGAGSGFREKIAIFNTNTCDIRSQTTVKSYLHLKSALALF